MVVPILSVVMQRQYKAFFIANIQEFRLLFMPVSLVWGNRFNPVRGCL